MNPMDSDGELDLTSEPDLSPPPTNKPDTSRAADFFAKKQMRVLFKCCRVYAAIQIPEGVRSGQLSSWRFHCPRCGRLVEIPF